MTIPTLTRGEVRRVSKVMRELGAALPQIGITWRFGPATRATLRDAGFTDYRGEGPSTITHDASGYYFGWSVRLSRCPTMRKPTGASA